MRCLNRTYHFFASALVMLALLASCEKMTEEKPDGTPEEAPEEQLEPIGEDTTVYGYVTSGGEALEGVVVSDGEDVTLTDSRGRYSLNSLKTCGSVFVSLPSGYEAPAEGVLPKFFSRLSKPSRTAERVDFELRKVDQSEYRMLVFGDMHLARRSFCDDMGQFRTFAGEINRFVKSSSVPVYALTLGDMTWDLYWSTNSFGLPEYKKEIQQDFTGLEIFHTMGNHDNDPTVAGDAPAALKYEENLCPNHYSFNIGGVHYIVLDDILYKNDVIGTRDFWPQVSIQQTGWLKKDLQHVEKSTPVLVAMHDPLYKRDGAANISSFMDFIRCFEGFDHVQFLTGHMHVVYNVDMLKKSIHIYESNCGAVCGAWWMTYSACKSGLHLCSDGAPGGYKILDISGKDIKWRYKGTGCQDDFQFRTYDRNEICLSADKWVPHASRTDQQAFVASAGEYAAKSSSNQVLINVWDYDPSWTITVKEDGRNLPVTQLKNKKDPLYLAVYEAYEYEHGYSVSYPGGQNDHTFSVTASAPGTSLEISVTDRFGRKYTQTMKRPQPLL